jgi:hypothetical protein
VPLLVIDAVEDIISQQGVTMSIKDEAQKKAAREALAEGPIAIYLERIQKMLDARGGAPWYIRDDVGPRRANQRRAAAPAIDETGSRCAPAATQFAAAVPRATPTWCSRGAWSVTH